MGRDLSISGSRFRGMGSGIGAMTNLITRLENAEGPDRELDAEIQAAIGGPQIVVHIQYDGYTETLNDPPPYSASLDAAITLIPEGWAVYSASWNAERAEFMLWKPGHGALPNCEAKTPAIALCIASLRARGENG